MLGSFKFLSYLCGRKKNDDYEVKGILYINDFISCRRAEKELRSKVIAPFWLSFQK